MLVPTPICLADGESVDHLLLGWKTAYSLWVWVLGWFGLSWAFPKTLLDHCNAWNMMLEATKGKHLWWTSYLAILWVIWKERNSSCFDERFTDTETQIRLHLICTYFLGFHQSIINGIPAGYGCAKLERIGLSISWCLICSLVSFIFLFSVFAFW